MMRVVNVCICMVTPRSTYGARSTRHDVIARRGRGGRGNAQKRRTSPRPCRPCAARSASVTVASSFEGHAPRLKGSSRRLNKKKDKDGGGDKKKKKRSGRGGPRHDLAAEIADAHRNKDGGRASP